jgi:hypothetical protein
MVPVRQFRTGYRSLEGGLFDLPQIAGLEGNLIQRKAD